ncbi:MAG: DoxX family protein, partial [Flavobacterium sp.]
MKNLVQTLLTTNPNIGFSIARFTLGLVIFPHGAQKLLGLFGGYGYSATMESFTTQMGLPGIVAFSIIMIEFFGSISLVLGFISRFWAIALAGMFVGIIYTTQLDHG